MPNLANLYNRLSQYGNTFDRWVRNPRMGNVIATNPKAGQTFANLSRKLGNAASMSAPITANTVTDILAPYGSNLEGNVDLSNGVGGMLRSGLGGELAQMFEQLSRASKRPSADDGLLILPRMFRE